MAIRSVLSHFINPRAGDSASTGMDACLAQLTPPCCSTRKGKQKSLMHLAQRHHRRMSRPCRRAYLLCRASTSGTPQVLFSMSSQYNNVQVVEFPPDFPGGGPLPGVRALILDGANIHSLYRKESVLIGESLYWEHPALVAELAPDGPISILGLGSGTVARIIHHYWPARVMHGWELDEIVLHAGRLYMGLDELEDGKILISHVEDALAPETEIEGGFAGIIVDLFADKDIIQPLKTAEAWQHIRKQMQPGGSCIVNMGESDSAVGIMAAAFKGAEVFVKRQQANVLALAGRNPVEVQHRLPAELRHIAENWTPWQP